MIVIAAIVIGAALGWRRAGKLGGNTRDRIQYAAVHAIVLAAVGVLATVLIDRAI
ncbi:hypothetical protein Q4511_06595 [Paracoccus sp. 1_MG-2023]|uniref:hypothetical protein n=1 Tax=unclassified Paracoccus (in: a-proteobacteria) TaxID=2688777 RepID=UPI001C08BAA9|nr:MULTISPECIES: hypothetical protein [unclassified Paracoccus (in: a-proteobacteria)]MBU2958429.1 hypothetical protein [Paracoccus sp. C2R09]MDO6668586.1 hypothetical protein [Paracoccus sp. 1_MG-2023]